ncbi:MAG: hypothetical protein O9350_11855 [Microcystis sp. LE19-388.1G]|nr:hypothetical protein [Microcystis sp. LE19-388.1G]
MHLRKFLFQISIPKKNPRKPKKKRLRDSVFNKGDCLSIDIGNGLFGAAIVLYDEVNSEYGLNIILLTDYFNTMKPDKNIVQKSNSLMYLNSVKKRIPYLLVCYQQFFKKYGSSIENIGNIPVNIDYNLQTPNLSYGRWDSIGPNIRRLVEEKIVSKEIIKIKNMISKSWFKKFN